MPLRERICPVAFSIEATPGTAETLDASEAAFFVYDWNLERDVDMQQRPGPVGMAQHAAQEGLRGCRVTFSTDYVMSGANGTPPFWMTIATACGCDLATDVITAGTTTRTATIAAYLDGYVEKIVGAVGTFTVTGGQGAARINFTFTGKEGDDADVAVLAPTLPTVVPPRWADGSATVHAVAVKASGFTFDRGGEVVLRENPNHVDGSGIEAAHFVDAAPTLTLDPETDLVATKNWQAVLRAKTEAAISIVHGDTAGNILTLAAAAAQVMRAPNTRRNKLVVKDLMLQLNGAAPFTITGS